MSALRVLWPDEEIGGVALAVLTDAEESTAEILPFAPRFHTGIRPELSHDTTNVVGRARALFENRSCRHCGYPVVEPIELADGFRNRKGAVIPGTATLVGFRCRGCQSEWST